MAPPLKASTSRRRAFRRRDRDRVRVRVRVWRRLQAVERELLSANGDEHQGSAYLEVCVAAPANGAMGRFGHVCSVEYSV